LSPTKKSRRAISENSTTTSDFDIPTDFTYNSYSELMARDKAQSSELSVTETLRLLEKAYHYDFNTKLRDIVAYVPYYPSYS
jgi:hypothetical protein